MNSNNYKNQREYIVNLLKDIEEDDNKRYILFKDYIEKNKIELKNLNDKEFDILIYSIVYKAPVKITKYIIENCKYDTFNYSFELTNPLFMAIKNELFEIANLLIGKKADINYMVEKDHNIVDYLYYCSGFIYYSQIKYIIRKGFNLKGFKSELFLKIIRCGYNNKLLQTIFDSYIIDNDYILNLLSIYKHQTKLSNEQVNQIINNEKGKIKISEAMYEIAIKHNLAAIPILLKYDSDGPQAVLNRIQMYEMLDKVDDDNEFELLLEIVEHELLSFELTILEALFRKIKGSFDLKLSVIVLIEKIFVNSGKTLTSSHYEIFLLAASRVNNIELIKTLLGLLLYDSRACKESLKRSIEKYSENKSRLEFLHNLINKRKYESKLCKYMDNQIESLLSESNDTKNKLTIDYIKNYDIPFLTLILNMAIKSNSIDVVIFLTEHTELKNKLDINIPDKNGEYPLIEAINISTRYSKNTEIFKYLLDHGGNINIKESPLILALQSQKYLIIKYLLEMDISLMDMIKKCDSPVIKAIYQHNLDQIIHFSSEKSININNNFNKSNEQTGQVEFTFTPLILSYLLNYQDIFEFLLEHSDINELDRYGYSIFHYSVLKEDLKNIKLLIERGSNVDFKRTEWGYGHSAIDISISIGNKEITWEIINSKKIDVNEINNYEEQPIITVMKSHALNINDKLIILEYLLKNGSDVNIMDNTGKSAIALAIQQNSLPIVELFVRYGADIEFIDEYKNSPLSYAIKLTSLEIVEFLIRHHTDVNYIDIFDISPLAYAIQEQYLPIIKCLIENGADEKFIIQNINKFKKQEQTMLQYSLEYGDLSIVQYLLECHGNNNFKSENEIQDIFDILFEHNYLNIFEYFIHNIIDINDITGELLKLVVSRNNIDYLKILVEHNININLKDKNEYSPLSRAIHIRNESMVIYLLEKGADINNVNQHIEVLRNIAFFDEFNILKILVEHRLDINAKDMYNDIPIIYAISNRNTRFVEYMLQHGADVHYIKNRNETLSSINKLFNYEFYKNEYKVIKNLLELYK